MAEGRAATGRIIAIFVSLIVLLTAVALYAPRYRKPAAVVLPASSILRMLPTVEVWVSTADHRLKLAPQSDIALTARGTDDADVVVDLATRHQVMDGFGASMTDASAWLIKNRMSAQQRRDLLNELYGQPPNLNMNTMRLTIGSSDFSLNVYTLDDMPFGQTDESLRHFTAAPNLDYLIPVVRQALSVNPGLLIVSSSWTAPAWMKANENLLGGELNPQYYEAYADYLAKYVDVYRSHGIPIFALTLQNEPLYSPVSYPGMVMDPATRIAVIKLLGPKLAARTAKTRILEWDHNWAVPAQPLAVLADPGAAKYVDGVAWHCYEGSPYEQGKVHRAHPDKDTYITECTGGDWPLDMNGELLWFSRNLLVTGTRQWARGVIYWNLALDERHGPQFGGCRLCKGLITINSQTGEVTRNDEYYAIAHFSRFVEPGAVRVKSTDTDADKHIANVAFQNSTDGSIVMVMVNINKHTRRVSVAQGNQSFAYDMPAESVATFVWNQAPAATWVRRALLWLNKGRNPGVEAAYGP
ncbi:glycosyl hydrolase [Luteibacter aegosomaticola]|uniref:glycoside hydrolase family 30 protein n=1 Tax=Luteibacter aegosomaticola TaxID=2911538 RepID=UPI001FF79EC8|nr:glycoside hydrolase family 30 beta sandwich domain-containing protein [Luteibacter aegosomaticola]UPG90390.1 glycosyl hydrolase [Luteibacter aegosomaticola]